MAYIASGARAPASAAPQLAARPYWNPYVAGVGIGLVLLATFAIMGRGLGASGAFSSFLVWLIALVSPEHAATNPVHAGYLNDGKPLASFLVYLVLGTFTGALVSGATANRIEAAVERGPRASIGLRLALAFVGGVIMAVGAKLALGCTSGQALTGGAMLNVGSWAFMIMVFVGGYAVAPFVRKEWT